MERVARFGIAVCILSSAVSSGRASETTLFDLSGLLPSSAPSSTKVVYVFSDLQAVARASRDSSKDGEYCVVKYRNVASGIVIDKKSYHSGCGTTPGCNDDPEFPNLYTAFNEPGALSLSTFRSQLPVCSASFVQNTRVPGSLNLLMSSDKGRVPIPSSPASTTPAHLIVISPARTDQGNPVRSYVDMNEWSHQNAAEYWSDPRTPAGSPPQQPAPHIAYAYPGQYVRETVTDNNLKTIQLITLRTNTFSIKDYATIPFTLDIAKITSNIDTNVIDSAFSPALNHYNIFDNSTDTNNPKYFMDPNADKSPRLGNMFRMTLGNIAWHDSRCVDKDSTLPMCNYEIKDPKDPEKFLMKRSEEAFLYVTFQFFQKFSDGLDPFVPKETGYYKCTSGNCALQRDAISGQYNYLVDISQFMAPEYQEKNPFIFGMEPDGTEYHLSGNLKSLLFGTVIPNAYDSNLEDRHANLPPKACFIGDENVDCATPNARTETTAEYLRHFQMTTMTIGYEVSGFSKRISTPGLSFRIFGLNVKGTKP